MSKLIDLSVQDFISETASDSPAPGGGSCAALAGAKAAALGQMVIALSVGKKSFQELDQEIQTEIENQGKVLARLQAKLVSLIDEDTQAFLKVMGAFKLPKSSDSEKQRRARAIAEANLACTSVPLATAKAIMEIMEILPLLAKYGNKNCISDLGSAMLFADAGLGAAQFNVLINLPGVKDQNFVQEAKKGLEEQKVQASQIKAQVLDLVQAKLG